MTQQPPELLPVPMSLWTWPDLETTSKNAFLWMWSRNHGRVGVVQFRPLEMAAGLGRRQARRVPEWLGSLEDAGLVKIHGLTENLVTLELLDPDQVAVVKFQVKRKQKTKKEIPQSILSHGKLSAEAKLSWISIWNRTGRRPGLVEFRLLDLAKTIGRDHERGARRWWALLQECGFATEVSLERGKVTARIHDPNMAASFESKLQLAAARKQRRQSA